MISFIICLALLIGGYFVYGKVVENTFAPDDRETPAVRINDGVDYVVMPQWKLFLVQLLNIAGLGPIFGAMQGALWGPVVFLWITFGTIFAGGVHDYFSLAGEGIGTVTRNGLKVPKGEPAINPVPRQMIEKAIRSVTGTRGAAVTISIPNGEALACKTFNERLGVVGGLSILGTTGIVRPMSEEAVRESLRLELSMCRAEYGAACALVTGYSGETYLKQTYPNCGGIVLCSNYLGYLLDCAEEMQFTHLLLAGRIGKLIKPAANIMYLHSHTAGGQREILCTHAALAGASRAQVQELYDCPTTKLAQQLLEQFQLSDCVWSSIAEAALENCIWRTHRQITTGLILLDESDHVLAEAGAIPEILQVWRRHETT